MAEKVGCRALAAHLAREGREWTWAQLPRIENHARFCRTGAPPGRGFLPDWRILSGSEWFTHPARIAGRATGVNAREDLLPDLLRAGVGISLNEISCCRPLLLWLCCRGFDAAQASGKGLCRDA